MPLSRSPDRAPAVTMHPGELPITDDVVRDLVGAQFPRWRDLPVRRFASPGTVNAIFRLGDRLGSRAENRATDGVRSGRIVAVPPVFVPGLELAGDFYARVVRPLLAGEFPGLRYAAALLGPGSEVAGFDTPRSTDHDWGPRLQLLLPDEPGGGPAGTHADGAAENTAAAITAMLARRLPESFRGYPVRFSLSGEPASATRHHVRVAGLGGWLTWLLGFDPRNGVTLPDWLATPTQRLAEFTTGQVFHDAPGELTHARQTLAWYPDDVWRYVLACQWQRVDQEEPFPGRCAEAGDELGSLVVTARLARDLMRLCLLMHRRYPPYSKWLGTAFSRLPGNAGLAADLTAAISASGYQEREPHLTQAYRAVAQLHNQAGLTAPLDTRTRLFHDRPFQVIGGARFAAALRESIGDPRINRLPLAGAADQFIDSTDAAGDLRLLRACTAAAINASAINDGDIVLP